MASNKDPFSLSIALGDSSFSAQGELSAVLDAYEDFKKLLSSEPKAAKTSPPVSRPTGQPRKAATTVTSTSATDLPLKPFVKGLTLKGNKEKATAIVAWANATGNETGLTHAEIEELWKKTPFKAPKNLRRDVRGAETEGWLHQDGKAGSPESTYRITGYGQQMVDGWKAPPSD
jgi:hypothetical protein